MLFKVYCLCSPQCTPCKRENKGIWIWIEFPDSKVHGANMGPVGPRWAPCWPHEPCYQGLLFKLDFIETLHKLINPNLGIQMISNGTGSLKCHQEAVTGLPVNYLYWMGFSIMMIQSREGLFHITASLCGKGIFLRKLYKGIFCHYDAMPWDILPHCRLFAWQDIFLVWYRRICLSQP